MTADAAEQFVELIDLARSVRENAYAPYSKFRVGAALRTANGAVFAGCNVENATYGATLCAERAAVASMVAAGQRDIVAIAVFTDAGSPAMPCGICRQVLMEFARPEALVIAASPAERKEFALGSLLPHAFVLRS